MGSNVIDATEASDFGYAPENWEFSTNSPLAFWKVRSYECKTL